MNRWILVIAVTAVSLARPDTVSAANAEAQRISTVLSVDGAPCGSILKMSGGDMRFGTSADMSGSGAPAAAAVFCAPLSFEIMLPVAEPLARLLTGMCSGQGTGSQLVVSDVTGAGTAPVRTLEYMNAILTEVRLPSGQLAGSTRITLVFQGTASRITEAPSSLGPPPTASTGSGTGIGISHAVVELPGIKPLGPPTQGIVIRRTITALKAGNARLGTTLSPGQIEVSPLVFTRRAEQCGELSAWRDDAVKAGSPLPRNGRLTYYSAASGPVPTKPVMILNLSGVGMSKVEYVPLDTPEPRQMTVELSCQGACIEFPPAPPPPAAAARRGA